MPHVFIDVDDGERYVRDAVGMDIAQVEDTAYEVRELLCSLGEAAMAKGRPRVFLARVRDADGRTIYRGSARLRIKPAGR